jgi:hypothetical protein
VEIAAMAVQTTSTIVSFSSSFLLPGFDQPQPPGRYRIDHDEESVDGMSWLVWRRVGSFIHLPGIGLKGATHQMVALGPKDLEALLVKDQNHS